MSERLMLEIQTITLVHIVAVVLAIIFFMIIYIKANKDYALKAFLVVQISAILWMVFKIFKTVSPNISARWWFIVGYYVCTCILEFAFLEFAYAYYKGKPLNKKVRNILLVFPIAQILMVLSNPITGLLYKEFDFWGDKFGSGFYAHMAIEYGFIFVGMYFCWKRFKVQYTGKKIIGRMVVSFAIMAPLILNMLYITKVTNKLIRALGFQVVFDITPIVFTWSMLVFVYATLKMDFVNLSPLLRHEVVHNLDTAICVLDSSYEPIYSNKKLEHILDDLPKASVGEIIESVHIPSVVSKPQEVFYKEHMYLLNIIPIESLLEHQYIVFVEDMTLFHHMKMEQERLKEDLKSSNDSLMKSIEQLKESSKVSARTFVARELHDIIGHSLVVAIKLIEVAKMYQDIDRQLSIAALNDAGDAVSNGISQIGQVISSETGSRFYTADQVELGLKKILHATLHTNLKTRFTLKGKFYRVSDQVFEMLQKVTLEFITNTLKYAKATEVFSSIVLSEDEVNYLLVDNGFGCSDLKIGNGLRGIKERVEQLGGSVTYSTSPGDGFMCKLVVTRIDDLEPQVSD